jgi:hypothetical protein
MQTQSGDLAVLGQLDKVFVYIVPDLAVDSDDAES